MLVDVEGQALALMKERLARPAGAAPERVARLIAGLEERRFAERRKAFDQLRALEAWVEEPLRQALENKPTLESRRQIEELLALLRKNVDAPQPRGEPLRACRAVWIAELIGTNEARALLKAWADGPPSARLTIEARAALGRLTKAARAPG